MRRTLRYAAIWCGATAVAVCVSWFGVRGVLRSEFVDDVPVPVFQAQLAPVDRKTAVPEPTARRTATPTPRPTPSGALKLVQVAGGAVVFRLGGGACRLVSASPNSGYTATVARNTDWIRVDLARGGHGSGVFCIAKEQRTDTWEY
ncbi:MAG: hypothetical protein HOY71_39595 [Nonomuraea sp.]|nr:hypothetical protein [Nonomuraea sp.]